MCFKIFQAAKKQFKAALMRSILLVIGTHIRFMEQILAISDNCFSYYLAHKFLEQALPELLGNFGLCTGG